MEYLQVINFLVHRAHLLLQQAQIPHSVAPQQPSVTVPQSQQPSPVVPQQQLSLFPNLNTGTPQQQFIQPQASPNGQQLPQSPKRAQTNLFSQQSISAPEANEPSIPGQRIPNSNNGRTAGNKGLPLHPMHKMDDSASDVNSQIT